MQKGGAFAAKVEAGKSARIIAKKKKDIANKLVKGDWSSIGRTIAEALKEGKITKSDQMGPVINWFYQSGVDMTGSKNEVTRALGKLFSLLGSMKTPTEQDILLRGIIPKSVQGDIELARLLRPARRQH